MAICEEADMAQRLGRRVVLTAGVNALAVSVCGGGLERRTFDQNLGIPILSEG